jgi:4-amino-4-deoxy-L-arabinose transferase-like glycosyltransferase
MSVEERLLWLWLATVVIFFTAAQFRLDYYIFPAAPACCMLAALAVKRAAAETSWARRSLVVVAVCLTLGGAIAGAVLFRLNLRLPWTAIALPMVLIAGGAACLSRLLRGAATQAVGLVLATLLGVYTVVVLVGLPVLEESRPTAALGRWISRQADKGVPIGLYRLEDWRGSIRYYAKQPVVSIESPEELRDFLLRWPRSFVVMVEQDRGSFHRSGVELEEVAGRPAIVGRSGKYLRRQIWGRLVVTRRRDQSR